MIGDLFTPRAERELFDAAAWIAEESPEAAATLLKTALAAPRQVCAHPHRARVRLRLAPARFRFWSLRGFPYLLVIDAEHDPPVVARFVHQARDLPASPDDAGDG